MDTGDGTCGEAATTELCDTESLVPAVPVRADDPCPICFDALEAESTEEMIAAATSDAQMPTTAGTESATEESGVAAPQRHRPRLTHCALGCGRNFHAACISRWYSARGAQRTRGCPICRARWRDDDPALELDASAAEEPEDVPLAPPPTEGYVNLATLQPGVQAMRDTSTYSTWLERHQRRREQIALENAHGARAALSGQHT